MFPFANIGPRWSLNWVAYVEEFPFTWFNSDEGLVAFADHLAVHVPQGGVERQFYTENGISERHYRSAAIIVRASENPVVYERRHPDGSKEVYALSDGGLLWMRRFFLTAVVDPHGQALSFTWDAQFRLVALTDALGQVTTLDYEHADPLKITRVTDPFGRTARFTYDAAGRLETVTDVVNLTSRFIYGDADFIAMVVMETSFR